MSEKPTDPTEVEPEKPVLVEEATPTENPAPKRSLWANPDRRVKAKVYVYTDKDCEEIHQVLALPNPAIINLGLVEHEIVTWWSVPDKPQIDELKRQSAFYDPMAARKLTNPAVLTLLLYTNHLKEIVLPEALDDSGFKLEFNVRNTLTEDCVDKLYKLHPAVLDTAAAIYQAETQLLI